MNRHVFVSLSLFSIASATHAEVKLPVIFSDHMVLQRGEPVPVWGTASNGEEVKVTFAVLTDFL